jgi:hypothetical protein
MGWDSDVFVGQHKLGWHVCQIWEHSRCFKVVLQDAISRCGVTWDVECGQGQKELELFERNLCCWFFPSLCLLPSFHSMCVLFAKKSHWILVECDLIVLVCRVQLFSRPQEQQLYHQMGKREVGKHHVCVHPQLQYTHWELMLYTALLPRAHQIEQMWHFGMNTFVSFLVHCSSFLVLCCLLLLHCIFQ